MQVLIGNSTTKFHSYDRASSIIEIISKFHKDSAYFSMVGTEMLMTIPKTNKKPPDILQCRLN